MMICGSTLKMTASSQPCISGRSWLSAKGIPTVAVPAQLICEAKPEVLLSAFRDREGAVRTFMAAAKTLQAAYVFTECAVEAPQFPDKLAAVELFEAYQGAALAVQELDKAVGELPPQADLQSEFFSCAASMLSSAGQQHTRFRLTAAMEAALAE